MQNRPPRWLRALPVSLAVLVLSSTGASQAVGDPGHDCAVPGEIGARDWAGIRAAYEAARHAALPAGAGFRARNPRQRWDTLFDGRGFTTQPDSGAWGWGLELVRYGFADHERSLVRPQCVDVQGARVEYRWDDSFQEWFVNDGRGLEHGFTVQERPTGRADGDDRGALKLTLAVRGELRPEVQSDGRGVRFLDEAGAVALTYSGLVVFDADGLELAARLESVSEGLLLSVYERGARYPLTIDPVAQQAYVKASNPDGSDQFGASVALSGDTLVVGAPNESSKASGVNGNQSDNSKSASGAAYVFVRQGASWSQQAYLKASNPDPFDWFGWSVSVSGDTIVVGARGERSAATGVNGDQFDNSAGGSGAAYVFQRSGTVWSQQAYLKASNTALLDYFGRSVSVSGDTVVVGAIWEDSQATGVNGDQGNNLADASGAAYVFVRNEQTWSQQAYLKASNTDPADFFGYAVSVSGDTIVVSADKEDSQATGVNGDELNNGSTNSGAAYVFVRNGSIWAQEAYLKSNDTAVGDAFGWSAAIAGDTIVVGAVGEDSSATGVNGDPDALASSNSGAAYVFVRSGTSWSQEAYLKASNTGIQDFFGRAVAVHGDRVVVSAIGEQSGSGGVNGNQADDSVDRAGAAYVFAREGSTWSQEAYLKASYPDFNDWFGSAVAVADGSVAAGAFFEDSSASGIDGEADNNDLLDSGAVFLFDLAATFTPYCTQTKPTSVQGCVASLSVSDASLAGGVWNATDIPRSASLPAGNSLGIFIYSAGVGQGPSTFIAEVPFGSLCIQGFQRTSPRCPPALLATLPGVCNTGLMSLAPACNGGALGLEVGEDVNVQFWYRDPTSGDSGNANLSNAIYYTLL